MNKWTKIIEFNERIWSSAGVFRRSKELTPLYIERFRGPRKRNGATSHSFWELTCVLSGSGGVLVDGAKHPFSENTTFLLPPSATHNEYSEGNLDTIWIGLDGTRLLEEANDMILVESEGLVRKIMDLWRFSGQRHGLIGSELDALTASIIGQLFRISKVNNDEKRSHSILGIVKRLQMEFASEISFAELADESGCSEGHFYRRFKETTGKTPSAFLKEIRIRNACHLLRNTNLPMSEIATLSGYQDQFYFSRVFKQLMKTSPTQFKNVES